MKVRPGPGTGINTFNMAVDLSMKSDSNNNNAVDLSISRTEQSVGIAHSSENTLQIVEKLMEARAAANMTECDKTNIEMTALNLLCLARLQEILHPAPPSPSPSPAPPPSQACNRKLYKCDYSDCSKVRQSFLPGFLEAQAVKIMIILCKTPSDLDCYNTVFLNPNS